MSDAPAISDRDDTTTALWRTALELLGEREGAVLSLRHGAFGGERLSFGDIGRELGISRQRTHQIYEAALEKLVQNEALRGLVHQLAASASPATPAPRAVAVAAPAVAEAEAAAAPVAVEAPSAARASAPDAESAAVPKKAPKSAKGEKRKAGKALAANEAPRVERRAGSVVVRPPQAAARASGTGAPAGLEKLIGQLEGLQKFHAGVESRVRELLAYIEREMPR
jgi:hypothetical protein